MYMLPSNLERSWATAPPLVSAIAHGLSFGMLTFIPGAIVYWLWKDRSKFVAFNALQSAYLAGLLLIMAIIGGGLVWTHVFAWLGFLILTINYIGGLGLFVVGTFAQHR